MTETTVAEAYAADFMADLHAAETDSERHQQALSRVLGFSDIGGCPEQGRLFLSGHPFTDETDLTAARIGNYVDAGLKAVRGAANPHLLLDLEVSCTLPSGVRIKGHPDEVDPRLAIVIDYKTKDGLAAVRRTGPSDKERMQRALQYLACLQSGVFTSEDGYVGNIYLDRAGNDRDVFVDIAPWRDEMVWVDRADTWLRTVLFAAQNDRPAERDAHMPFCRSYCRFFSVCRGADTGLDGKLTGSIVNLVDLYAEAMAAETNGKALKDALRSDLLGLNGTTSTHQVRTIETVKGPRLEVTPLRSADLAV